MFFKAEEMQKDQENNKNVNEPDYVLEDERPYYDDDAEKEELEKVPVEYLGFLEKQKERRREHLVFWILLIIIVIGFAPGTRGKDLSPRTGEWRNHFTFGWGTFDYPDPEVHSTDFTEWYKSMTPELHEMRWIPYEKTHLALFGYLALPWAYRSYRFDWPDNLAQRMEELDRQFRPGHVMDIPRVLNSVNNAQEWNAIVVPLTLGTPREAKEWWDDHDGRLREWADQPFGTPLPQNYIDEANAYIQQMATPEGNQIPLIPD